MLTEAFSITDPDVQEFLSRRPNPHTASWFEHCLRNEFTVAQMMEGFGRWKAKRCTVEHRPSQPHLRLEASGQR